jgi:hypothetical protein
MVDASAAESMAKHFQPAGSKQATASAWCREGGTCRQGRALPSAKSERLMLEASLSVSPLVCVSLTRSLPACAQRQNRQPHMHAATT